MSSNSNHPSSVVVSQEAFESVSPSRLCKHIADAAELYGIKFHTSSRLGQLLKLCSDANDFNEVHERMVGNKNIRRGGNLDVLWIQSELNEFAFILAYPPVTTTQAWVGKVAQAACGSLFPIDERNMQPRSYQSELLALAWMQRCGFNPRIEEPDLVGGSSDKDEFAVAVKRLRSGKKTRSRLSEACNQITNSGRVGVVMLDVYCELPRRDSSIRGAFNDQAIEHQARADVNRFTRDAFSLFEPGWFSKHPSVVACYVFMQTYWENQQLGRFVVANHICYKEMQEIDSKQRLGFITQLKILRTLTPQLMLQIMSE